MSKPLQALRSQIDQAMSADRHRLFKQWQSCQRLSKEGKPFDRAEARLREELATSLQRVEQRRTLTPELNYPEGLPVCARREELLEVIRDHQVVVIAGETGSGKTTQLPKLCLELGRGVRGRIGHTQPRRIAARSVAARIAEELNSPLGETVGYQVRFTDHSSERTQLKLMTDGILLAEIQGDPYLSQYDTLIIDEAHERSLNIDFLLGYLKRLLPKRPDLKLIITSATIDLERFSQHFGNCPIVEVSGRTFPVDVWYRPLDEMPEEIEGDMTQAVVHALEELRDHERKSRQIGDVLVFLSGEREIRELHHALRKRDWPQTEILPLYARLSIAEQNRVFDLRGRQGRRIVLATNVAETSLTVPGIRYVIDTGLARISRYSVRSKVQRLPIEPVSQASAEQRKGRCGRVAEGICVRLYSEQDFQTRPAFTDPEIRRTNLAAVILQMLSMRLGEVQDFPFVDPPDSRQINDGYKLLDELGAVSRDGRLTEIGRHLSRMPVDPRIGRMLLASIQHGCVDEMLIIASALSIQDPRERPAEKQQAADEAHRRFWQEGSDFLTLVNLWRYYEEKRQALSQNQLRKLCAKEFLNFLRMGEWREIHYQLRLLLKELGASFNPEPAPEQAVHRAALAGLLSHIGWLREEREYLGARNRKFFIQPGSVLFKKQPKWMVAYELVETSKLYARTIGRIDPEWALDYADHLLKRDYFEPHWEMRSGQVVAYERVSLYGLALVEKRKVSYGPISPAESRQLFIRGALVEHHYGREPECLKHNRRLIAEIEALEAKTRKRDIVVDDHALFAFYDERIPAEIHNRVAFEQWLRKAEQAQPKLLYMERELLMRRAMSDQTGAQFPDHLSWGDFRLPLKYHFEPGHPEDGVTAVVPVGLLNRLPIALFEWLVPGMLRDKCIELIKGLPKQWRRQFVPVPDAVDRVLGQLAPDNVPLAEALGRALGRSSGVQVPASAWAEVQLDDHYRMNFRVVDTDGKRLGQGRDLAPLIAELRPQVQASLKAAKPEESIERSGIQRWDFGALPESHAFRQGGVTVIAYPALVDKGDSVAITLCETLPEAEALSRRGMARLLLLQQAQSAKYLRKELFKAGQAVLVMPAIGGRDAVLEDVMLSACWATACPDQRLPRDQAAFETALTRCKQGLVPASQELEKQLQSAALAVNDIRRKLAETAMAKSPARADIEAQLAALFCPGFAFDTPADAMRQYGRYLKAIQQRLERCLVNPQKDAQAQQAVQAVWSKLQAAQVKQPLILSINSEAHQLRWMIEEYRVSLFAQTLGTAMPVSEKRLEKQLEKAGLR